MNTQNSHHIKRNELSVSWCETEALTFKKNVYTCNAKTLIYKHQFHIPKLLIIFANRINIIWAAISNLQFKVKQGSKYHFAQQLLYGTWIEVPGSNDQMNMYIHEELLEKCVNKPDPSPIWHNHPWKNKNKYLKNPSQIIFRQGTKYSYEHFGN